MTKKEEKIDFVENWYHLLYQAYNFLHIYDNASQYILYCKI